MYSLRHHFLIAMPTLTAPEFEQSVAYVCEHDAHGSMAIVINKPLDIELAEIFDEIHIKDPNPDIAKEAALYGGPIQSERGFIVHPYVDKKWQSSFDIDKKITVTSSLDILEAIAHNQGPRKRCITLGYAGWKAGQLEQEIARNDWLVCPANNEVLFDVPYYKRWEVCAALLGVNIHTISPFHGHA